MTAVIVLLAVFALMLAMAYAGYRDGLFIATYGLVRCLIAFLCAMTFCWPLASLMTDVLTREAPWPLYFIPIAFIGVFGIVMALGRWLKVSYTDPEVSSPAIVDRVTGPVVGVLLAIVFTGTLLIFWSLLPCAKFVPADQGRINIKLGALDNGVKMLKFYDFMQGRMRGNKQFILEEAVVGREGQGARPGPGESFNDLNGNKEWDPGWLWKYNHYADIDLKDLPPVTGAGPQPAAAPVKPGP